MFALPYSDVEVPAEAELNKLLEKTKGRLFFHKGAGFLGSLMCSHKFVWDPTKSTAWCDGDTIGWNPQFFSWLTKEEQVTVLAHELWHTGYDHFTRLGDRCPDIWNQAADYVINLRMKDDGFIFGEKLMSLRPCLDEKYRGMTTEQVYELLVKEGGKPLQPDGGFPLLGDVVPMDGSASDYAQKVQKIMGSIVKARQVSQISGDDPGTVPGETTLLIENFLAPILPWEQLLQRWFTALSTDDYSWRRPSRRHQDIYLPSLLGDNGLEHLIYYLDISGSIRDSEILRFNSEVKFIHSTIKPKRLTLVTFDTKIQDIYEFTDDMPFDKIEVHGRGGTCLIEVTKHIEDNRPTAAVIFSDLGVKPMKRDPKVPLLWVVVGNPNKSGWFGKSIHIPRE